MYDQAVVAWWKDGPVPSIEERVAYLEGRTEEHTVAMGEVRGDIRELRAEMIRRFEQVDGRLHHMDTRFTWLIGVQFATLLAVIGALLGTAH